MNTIDNTGIENATIENTQSETGHDEAYEAAFAAELAAEEAGLETASNPDGLESNDSSNEESEELKQMLDAEERENMELAEMAQDEETALDEQEGAMETDMALIEASVGTDQVEAKPEKAKTPPAYLSFIAAVEAHAKALGLNVKEQKSFYQISSPANGHKLYVEKALKKEVSRIDTSLPREALVVNGRDISLPLQKPNGRIACHVDPSVESVKQALEVLATFGDKIPAPRKPVTTAATAA